jgi:hypothetical protein
MVLSPGDDLQGSPLDVVRTPFGIPFSSLKVYLLFKDLAKLAVPASRQLPAGLPELPLLGFLIPPQHIRLRKATNAGLPLLLRPPSGFLHPPGVFFLPLP